VTHASSVMKSYRIDDTQSSMQSIPCWRKFADWSTLSLLLRLLTWKYICVSPNHCKVMKAKPSRLIPGKRAANLELLIVSW